jgi:lipoprotein-releasing system permease protein
MLKNKKHSKNFSRPIVLISIIGVMLGVSVMVVTISIATGFQNRIKDKLLSFGNHIQIESMFQSNNNETSPIITLNESFTNLYNSQDIYTIQKYAYKSAIIQSKRKLSGSINELEGVIFKGLENFQENSFFNDYLVEGKYPNKSKKINDTIVISKEIGKKLNLTINDKVSAFFVSDGKPKQRNLTIGGIYETGLNKIDSKFIFIDLKYLQKINKWGMQLKVSSSFREDSSIIEFNADNFSKNGKMIFDWGNNKIVANNQFEIPANVDTQINLIGYEVDNYEQNNLLSIADTLIISFTSSNKEIKFSNLLGSEQYYTGGLEIYTNDEEKKSLIKNQLKLDFGPEFKITTIEEQHQEIFSWLNLIYQNVYIILGLMIAVAVINMSCALLVLIVEKTKMIGILKALGMKNISLIKIFVTHGGILLFYGFLAGNTLAILIIQLQNKFEFLKLSQENYYLDAVPMDYPLSTIIILNFSAFVFCLITMILPSIISSKTSPVKAINSEI